jgi:hypothetical protein
MGIRVKKTTGFCESQKSSVNYALHPSLSFVSPLKSYGRKIKEKDEWIYTHLNASIMAGGHTTSA